MYQKTINQQQFRAHTMWAWFKICFQLQFQTVFNKALTHFTLEDSTIKSKWVDLMANLFEHFIQQCLVTCMSIFQKFCFVFYVIQKIVIECNMNFHFSFVFEGYVSRLGSQDKLYSYIMQMYLKKILYSAVNSYIICYFQIF